MTVPATPNKLSFSYTGTVDSQSIPVILTQAEDYISSFHHIPETGRIVLEIAIELLQNIYHHSPIKNSPLNYFEIKKEIDGTKIITSNLLGKSETEFLKDRIDSINAFTPEELCKRYLDELKNRFITGENAGLGLITIRRKSGKPILYKFVPQDNNHYLFTVIVLV